MGVKHGFWPIFKRIKHCFQVEATEDRTARIQKKRHKQGATIQIRRAQQIVTREENTLKQSVYKNLTIYKKVFSLTAIFIYL